jgi:hypothetical protein
VVRKVGGLRLRCLVRALDLLRGDHTAVFAIGVDSMSDPALGTTEQVPDCPC